MGWRKQIDDETRAEGRLDAELRFHVEQQIAEYVASGMTENEARKRARMEFGGIDQVKEEVHEARRGYFVETLMQDVRYGLRMLRKDVGSTAIAVLTLALGIGANTAIFSVVNGVLLRPLPFPEPGQLVGITNGTYPKGGFAAMREEVKSMEVAAYFEGHEYNLTRAGEPVRLNGTLVSSEFFSVLGARAQLGETFTRGQDQAGRDSYVILSHHLWQQRFSGDPSIVGRVIDLEGIPRQIVGVMPADFRFPSPSTDLWIPLGIDPRDATDSWAGDYMPVMGRLKPGATMERAAAEVQLFQSHVRTMFPWPMTVSWNAGISVVPLQRMLVGDLRARLLILLGAVILVLLIACANVANLTLSRASARAKEIAIRTSLGAGRGRIMRQLITESIVMACGGGALGVALAAGGLSILKASFPEDTPGLGNIAIDWRVLAFTAALAILAGMISGLVPALQCSRTELTLSLKSSGRGVASGGRHARRALVTGEIALAVLLVSAAGLLIRSLWTLSHVNPGFSAEHLATARITPNESFCDDAERCVQFYRQVVNRSRVLPGVRDAAVVNTAPLGGRVNKRSIHLEGERDSVQVLPLVWQDIVSSDYFRLMRIPLLRGREFTDADSSGNPPVAILSAATAHRFWPNEDAVGKHIKLADTSSDWCTVIGVVGDVRAFNLERSVPEWLDGTIYLPYGANATLENKRVPAEMTLAVRTLTDESSMADSIREVVSGLSQDAPVSEVQTMQAVVSESTAAPRSITSLFAAFAAIAFVLGAIGIYGVIAFFVGQRTREIGIRVALGAQRSDVLKMVVNEGLSLAMAGVIGGVAAALALTRLLTSLLYGVSATDPFTLGGVALLFGVVALVASYVPARRAMRVDPVIALREE